MPSAARGTRTPIPETVPREAHGEAGESSAKGSSMNTVAMMRNLESLTAAQVTLCLDAEEPSLLERCPFCGRSQQATAVAPILPNKFLSRFQVGASIAAQKGIGVASRALDPVEGCGASA